MLITQFPDLTEFEWAAQLEQDFKTQFAFYLESPCSGYNPKNFGFTALSCMNNWWPGHGGEERQLTLWWKKQEQFKKRPARRKKWEYNNCDEYAFHLKDMAASGCGLKIGVPPFASTFNFKQRFHRFFTLMRMPVEATPAQIRLLEKYNFRLIDIGKIASYWVNGWKPDRYDIDIEYKYFGTSQAEWDREYYNGD